MAEKFLSMVISQYRLPECIISDFDYSFHGHFWDELISLLNITLIFSMVSYPQTDRIAEVTNYTIE